jgi:serine/threonine protein kinase
VPSYTVVTVTNSLLSVDCAFEATLPGLSDRAMPFIRLIQWATSSMEEPDWEETLALDFLDCCMDLNSRSRLSAANALKHPFLSKAEEDELVSDDVFLT